MDRPAFTWGICCRITENLFFFAIPWTAFAVFWMAAAAGFKIPDFKQGFDFFPLFGLPFILVGLGLLLRPFFDYFKAYKVVYAITNRRALIIYFGSKKKIRSYELSEIGPVTRIEKADGTGNLYFSVKPDDNSNTARFSRVAFKAIPQVKLAQSYLKHESVGV